MTNLLRIVASSLLVVILGCASGPQAAPESEGSTAPESGGEASGKGGVDLAFVMLSAPGEIDVGALGVALERWGVQARELEQEGSAITFMTDGGMAAIGSMPAPIPWGDLEGPVRAAFMWPEAEEVLRPHGGHVIVSLLRASGSPLERKLRLTKVVAAVAETTSALGVYWGDGPAVHEASTFATMARDPDTADAPLPLWLGVSLARPDESHVSVLTFGMEALGHRNLLVKGRDGNATLGFVFDLARYMVLQDVPIEHGHTVGHTATQRILVEHRPSPVAASETVIAIDLPDDYGTGP